MDINDDSNYIPADTGTDTSSDTDTSTDYSPTEISNPFTGEKFDTSTDTEEAVSSDQQPRKTLKDIANADTDKQEKNPLKEKDEVIKRQKAERNELKRKAKELAAEKAQALEERDIVKRKLIEREEQELNRKLALESKENWIAEAKETGIPESEIEDYIERAEYYAPLLVERKALDQALNSVQKPHLVLNTLLKFMDEKNIGIDVLTDPRHYDDRRLRMLIKDIERDVVFGQAGNSHTAPKNDVPPRTSQPDRKPLPSIEATTHKDPAIPKLPPDASRMQFLQHVAKYGTKGIDYED